MKTFNYESMGVRYKDCFFDLIEDNQGKLNLATYGYIEDDKYVSHIANVTVNVKENLGKNQVVIDNVSNTNIISFLLDLGIVKGIVGRSIAKINDMYSELPIVELDVEKLKEYCFVEEELKNVS